MIAKSHKYGDDVRTPTNMLWSLNETLSDSGAIHSHLLVFAVRENIAEWGEPKTKVDFSQKLCGVIMPFETLIQAWTPTVETQVCFEKSPDLHLENNPSWIPHLEFVVGARKLSLPTPHVKRYLRVKTLIRVLWNPILKYQPDLTNEPWPWKHSLVLKPSFWPGTLLHPASPFVKTVIWKLNLKPQSWFEPNFDIHPVSSPRKRDSENPILSGDLHLIQYCR